MQRNGLIIPTLIGLNVLLKKMIIYVIDVQTGKHTYVKNRAQISLYHGYFNDELDRFMKKLVNSYLKLRL